jgi:hypothetical protein
MEKLEDTDSVPFSWVLAIARISEPAHLVDMVAANLPTTAALKQRVLEALSVHDRLAIAGELLSTVAAAPSRQPVPAYSWLAGAPTSRYVGRRL